MTSRYSARTQAIFDRISTWPMGWLWIFALKQAWAAIFGGVLLVAIIVTKYVDLPWLARYDWLFIVAIVTQIVLLVTRLEKPHEVLTILLFHLVGLGMELFKTSGAIGSWVYPEDSVIRIATVPLFSGFMYAAVGSYIARVWRVIDFRFTHYPRRVWTVVLAVAIYVNFFTHHYWYDMRWLLFAGMAVLYWRTMIYFRLHRREYRMPLLVGCGLVALVIWVAENIGTLSGAWLYPDQLTRWHMVSLSKFGAWFLLMMISFVMVEVMHWLYQRWQAKAVAQRGG